MNNVSDRTELNGTAPRVEDMSHLVRSNYGHFTSMHVCNGRVRGLGLHLDRLQLATRELFACDLDREYLRACLGHAIGTDLGSLSLRVNVFSRALDRARLHVPTAPDVLVTITAAAQPPAAPLRLKTFRYQREMAALKHVGTFPLFHYRRRAQQAGFDDALFVGDDGRISEGSMWNIGFLEADSIVWPDPPQLRGISQQLLQAGLAHRGVPSIVRPVLMQDMPVFGGAFVTNSSTPAQAVACVDDSKFAVDHGLMKMLLEAYESNPWERV